MIRYNSTVPQVEAPREPPPAANQFTASRPRMSARLRPPPNLVFNALDSSY
jgi:hypothetical protein